MLLTERADLEAALNPSPSPSPSGFSEIEVHGQGRESRSGDKDGNVREVVVGGKDLGPGGKKMGWRVRGYGGVERGVGSE